LFISVLGFLFSIIYHTVPNLHNEIMKPILLLLATLFLLFAAVQYNDPDPLGWMGLYGFVAIMAALAAFGRYHRGALLLGIAICLVWLGTLLPMFVQWIRLGMPNIAGSMKATEPHIEYTREFLGLFLCLLMLFFLYFKARNVKQ
jgi:hypothetical protein